VEVIDGIVVDLLGKPLRTPFYIDPTENLEERPDNVLPQFIWIRVPGALLPVDGFEPGPEDHEEKSAPAAVLVFVVGLEDGPKHLVFARILGRPLAHESEYLDPRSIRKEGGVLLLKFPQEAPVFRPLDLSFDSSAISIS